MNSHTTNAYPITKEVHETDPSDELRTYIITTK